jgi:UDP-N-acetylmuramoylalanine--D-glutamate ligase
MREATESALANAQSGDTVILSPGCASMDEFEDFRQRGDVFKAIAKEWLDR